MKKILFVLGMIFSVYSFAEQGFSISETDTYQELSKKTELKKEQPQIYSYKTNPYSIFGVRIDDQHLLGYRSVLFDKNNLACGANVTMSGKSGYKVMVSRLSGMFTKFNEGDSKDAQGFEDDAKIVGIVYSDVNDNFTMVFKFKRKECNL